MSSTRRPRVLLADDYPGILTALTRLLSPDHDVVGSVSDGGAVLEAALRLQPDVVVLDLNMSNVNGLESCRRITQAIPHTKVIVLTATIDADVMQKALAMGACAFVEKQSDTNQLLSAIREACC
jgi:DNA-binding NarL/FixJ family response regulator